MAFRRARQDRLALGSATRELRGTCSFSNPLSHHSAGRVDGRVSVPLAADTGRQRHDAWPRIRCFRCSAGCVPGRRARRPSPRPIMRALTSGAYVEASSAAHSVAITPSEYPSIATRKRLRRVRIQAPQRPRPSPTPGGYVRYPLVSSRRAVRPPPNRRAERPRSCGHGRQASRMRRSRRNRPART